MEEDCQRAIRTCTTIRLDLNIMQFDFRRFATLTSNYYCDAEELSKLYTNMTSYMTHLFGKFPSKINTSIASVCINGEYVSIQYVDSIDFNGEPIVDTYSHIAEVESKDYSTILEDGDTPIAFGSTIPLNKVDIECPFHKESNAEQHNEKQEPSLLDQLNAEAEANKGWFTKIDI